MQLRAKFNELPITAIKPEGWVRRYLEHQRDGLTGHMEAAGYPFDSGAWTDPEIKSRDGTSGWWPYEQTGYWIDGLVRCGYLLGDEALINRARAQIDYVLDHPDPDGYLGPKFMKAPAMWNRWPHSIFFRAVAAYYLATGDERILPALTRHYLSESSSHSSGREVCNVEMILWTYERTGDSRLLEHVLKAFAEFNQTPSDDPHIGDSTQEALLSDRRASIHGVTFNEIAKLGAILYRYTGDPDQLKAAVNGYRKLDRDQMLVDGVPSSTEALQGKDPLDSHETCDIADYTWSAGHLLLTTGLAEYADKIERACFNAAPGAVRKDFKALQYFSCPNQVIADATSNHNLFMRGRMWMAYRPNPEVECCPGEVNRVMPNYAARMWLECPGGQGIPTDYLHHLAISLWPKNKKKRLSRASLPVEALQRLRRSTKVETSGYGLAAALYGPSRVTVKLGPETDVTIHEKTSYPFSDRIVFEIDASQPVEFTLWLRIPGWCRAAHLKVGGQPYTGELRAGSFIPVQKIFNPGDRVELLLPMEIRLRRWAKGGVSVERGPLVYALGIEEDWQVDSSDPRQTEDFPAWNLYPASRWNYALVVAGNQRAGRDGPDGGLLPEDVHLSEVEVIEKGPMDDPWSLADAPVELLVKARRVKGWEMSKRKVIESLRWWDEGFMVKQAHGNFSLTPQLPDPGTLPGRLGLREEWVRLVPYGCTHLRISIFPQAEAVAK